MKKLFVVLMMLAAVSASGQFEKVSNGLSQNEFIFSLTSIGNNIYAGTASGVYVSINSGLNWTQTSLNNQGVITMAVSGSSIYAGTNNGVFVSTNNGTTWTQTGSQIHNVISMAVIGNNGFAGTDTAGVYKTTNNGISWIQTSLNNGIVFALVANGNSLLAGGDGLFLSTDYGMNWSHYYSNMTLLSLCVNGNNLFAGTNSFGVWKSTNNGINWAQTSLTNKVIYSLAKINNNILAGLGGSIADTGGVYLSTSNGESWSNISQGMNFNSTIRTLVVANNYVFAGTMGQSVWRRPISEILGVQNIGTETPCSYSLSQNYPNPFNPSTKIKFSIPSSVSSPHGLGGNLVQLKIYDITGREIQTLVNERLQPGTYETTFDGSALNSGVYFYQLISGTFKETKRAILLK